MPPIYGIISLEKDIVLLRLKSLLKLSYLFSPSAVLGLGAVQVMSFILACKMVRNFPNGSLTGVVDNFLVSHPIILLKWVSSATFGQGLSHLSSMSSMMIISLPYLLLVILPLHPHIGMS
jgi:hypothetical protein